MTEETKLDFEKEICSRCGGSGEYSYCQSHGTRCFKCGGKKSVYTKKGQAAYNYFIDLCTIPASEVKEGQFIRDSGKRKVVGISRGTQEGASLENGVMVPYKVETAIFTFRDDSRSSMFIDSKVFVYQFDNTNLKKALEYQETLTKMGKPKKRLA